MQSLKILTATALVCLAAFLHPVPAAAQECSLHRSCGPGLLCDDGTCQPAPAALSKTGRLFWVAQNQAGASDQNPGTKEKPWKTISRATGKGVLAPGDAVIVRAGLYREAIRPQEGGQPNRRITFAAYPGEEVVVTGADPYPTGWTRTSGSAWKRPWTLPLHMNRAKRPGLEVFRRELVVTRGEVMRAVYARADVVPGTFYVEGPPEAPTAMYARFPGDAAPGVAKVEIATRGALFGPSDAQNCVGEPIGNKLGYYLIIGFTFRHAANQAQRGAVCGGLEGTVIEGVTVEWTNGMGITMSGRNHATRGTETSDNGQAGIGGVCQACRLERTTSNRNNWKGYPYGFEAGGGKFVKSRGLIVTHHTAKDNNGAGMWFDHLNYKSVVAYSHFEGNLGHGLFLELESDSNVVVGNVFVGNVFRNNNANGAGVSVIGSSHNLIAFNTFVQGGGLGVRIVSDNRAQATGNVLWGNLTYRNAMGVSFPKVSASEMLEAQATDLMSVWRLAPTSGYRGTAAALPSGWWSTLVAAYLAKDLDGDLRPASAVDPGADQVALRRAGGSITTRPAPITLVPGWNEVVWPQNAPASTSTGEALQSAGAAVVAVRDEASGLYLPAQSIDTIEALQPGRRYRIFAAQAATITF